MGNHAAGLMLGAIRKPGTAMEFRKAGWRTRLKRFALAADSWLDAGLWGAGRRTGEIHERIRSIADRLTVSGGKRIAAEFASEGLNIGIVGALNRPASMAASASETSRTDLPK